MIVNKSTIFTTTRQLPTNSILHGTDDTFWIVRGYEGDDVFLEFRTGDRPHPSLVRGKVHTVHKTWA